jgi:4'-phosphopantetheinyl transferase
VESGGASEEVREERLLSKALVRATLARYTGLPALSLRLGRGAHGKPTLSQPWLEAEPGRPALHFSVAHCPTALLLALSSDGALGVDVEPRDRGAASEAGDSSRAERLARRYFSPPETAALLSLPPGEPRRARFLELWTLKEAFVKARGEGIAAQPFRGFSFAMSTAGSIDFTPPPGPEADDPWTFSLLALGDAHVAALCAPGRALRLRCWRGQPGEPGVEADLAAAVAAQSAGWGRH